MKNDIFKVWVCQDCEKIFFERPIVCSICNSFEFYVKYGGEIHDTEELTKLIETYKDEESEVKQRVRV